MPEALLVQHCAPTLAGMKTGNLFSCPYSGKEELKQEIRRLNKLLRPKGMRILLMRCRKNKALLYLYRPRRLRGDLTDASAVEMLREYGYTPEHPERCVAQLAKKLQAQEDFPHEIGLFLGYPPEDVYGFIHNNACCSKCVGCWKVYGDEEKAKCTFARYKKCTAMYCDRWSKGTDICRLAVDGALLPA